MEKLELKFKKGERVWFLNSDLNLYTGVITACHINTYSNKNRLNGYDILVNLKENGIVDNNYENFEFPNVFEYRVVNNIKDFDLLKDVFLTYYNMKKDVLLRKLNILEETYNKYIEKVKKYQSESESE